MYQKRIYSVKNILKTLIFLITLPFIIGASSCQTMISQNPAELFEDGKLPKDLIRIQSQVMGLSLKEKEAIIERVKKDEKRTDLIKVAVIDSGVDLTHPDLQPFLDYKIVNGKIVGAGYDFMSHQPFGSNIFFDASLFAFGSGGIKNGKIVHKNESPLRLIKEINDRFREIVISEIQNDPFLNKSLFRYLTKDSFSIFGMQKILNSMGQYIRSYEEYKEKGTLENEKTLLDPKKKRQAKYYDPNRGVWTEMKLAGDSSPHLPSALGSIEQLEGADLFLNIIKNAYQVIDKEFNYQRNYRHLKEFISVNQAIDINDSKLDKTVNEKLMNTLDFILFGADAYNPLVKLEKIFKNAEKFKKLSLEESIDLFINDMKTYKDQIKNLKTLTKEELKYLKSYDKNLSQIENILNDLIQIAHDPKSLAEFKSNLRREVYRTMHPYIDQKSNENIHATHVSATIGKQLPNQIRIIPIRVTTQSIALQETVKAQLAEEMLADFWEWSKNPFYEPLKNQILSEYGLKNMEDSTIRAGLKKQLIAESMNTVFIKQLFEAIQKVGEMGAQLANVSLGMAYEKKINKEAKKESLIADLFSEYVRYKTGLLLKDKSPHTLFFVATGNEKAWIDGVTRVAFPVGIRSPRMEALSKQLNIPEAPNNVVKNLIPVVSVNEQGFLTEFANHFIIPNVESLGSTGEEIRAATPRSSKNGTTNLVNKILSPTMLWLSQINVIISSDTLNRVKSGELTSDGLEQEIQSNEILSKITSKLKDIMVGIFHLKNPIDRQKLSGTSMATPSATGKTAVIIAELLQRFKAKSSDLFQDSKLKMSNVIKEIFSRAVDPSYKLLTNIKIYTSGLKTWSRSSAEISAEKELKNILNNNKTNSKSAGSSGSIGQCSMIFN